MRTDVHRPSVINPDDYEFVAHEYVNTSGGFDLSALMFMIEERKRIREHMDETGGTYSNHEHGGMCHVCGSVNAIYTMLFYHRPTNSYVRTGGECAEKLGYGDSGAFRRKVENALEAKAGKAKAQALLAERDLSDAWTIYTAEYPDGFFNNGKHREEMIIRDMIMNLVKYGSASDKQYAFMAKLLATIPARAEIEAKRAAERAAAAPVPTGRIEVCGKVISLKEYDSDFGVTLKMVVKNAAGWCVFGTVPSSIRDEELVGKVVKFKATVEAARDDPKFGFFKRPTNGMVIEEKAA